MQMAHEVLTKVSQELYASRIRGHAQPVLSRAINGALRHLRENTFDFEFADFIKLLGDPWFVYQMKNFGNRYRDLIFQYFKENPPE